MERIRDLHRENVPSCVKRNLNLSHDNITKEDYELNKIRRFLKRLGVVRYPLVAILYLSLLSTGYNIFSKSQNNISIVCASETIESDITTKKVPTKEETKSINGLYDNKLKLNNDTLVVMIDFNNSACKGTEKEWHDLVFEDMNNYYFNVTEGQQSYIPTHETYGIEDDGVIRVKLNENLSNIQDTSEARLQFTKKELKEAIKLASYYIDLKQYGKYKIDSDDLTLIFVVGNVDCDNNYCYDFRDFACSFTEETVEDGVGLYHYDSNNPKCRYAVVKDSRNLSSRRNGLALQNMGILAHEVGHTKGMEDEYDESQKTSPVDVISLEASGCFVVDPMGQGHPSQPDALNLMLIGAIKPEVYDIGQEQESKIFTLRSLDSREGNHNALLIKNGNDDEFFLIYNMQLKGVNNTVSRYLNPKARGGIIIEHYCAKGNKDSNTGNGVRKIDVEEANESVLGYSAFDTNSITKNPFYTKDKISKFESDTVASNSNFYGNDNNQTQRTGIVVKVLDNSQDDMRVNVYVEK